MERSTVPSSSFSKISWAEKMTKVANPAGLERPEFEKQVTPSPLLKKKTLTAPKRDEAAQPVVSAAMPPRTATWGRVHT